MPDPKYNAIEANELLELAWGVIANAGGGDWAKESADWNTAVVKWGDRYHTYLGPLPRRPRRAGEDAMNWLKASRSEIDAKIALAIREGRGITVSAGWLQAIMAERDLLAKLAKCQDAPQFLHPMEAMQAVFVRDQVLAEATVE